jgi:hypothetical protein
MSKYAKMDGLSEMVVELRDAGTPWDAEGGIVDRVRSAYPAYTTKSAIPLRKLYHAAKANPVKATKARVIAARKRGDGWAKIAIDLDSTEAGVKKLAAGTEWAEGRVYVSADGATNIVDLAADAA